VSGSGAALSELATNRIEITSAVPADDEEWLQIWTVIAPEVRS